MFDRALKVYVEPQVVKLGARNKMRDTDNNMYCQHNTLILNLC